MRRALVIGYGSIGGRHVRVLQKLGCDVAVVTRRQGIAHVSAYASIADAISNFNPDYCLITNETSRHFESVRELVADGFSGVLFVEKPLFHQLEAFPENGFKSVIVGYHLRVHPAIRLLYERLRNGQIYSVQCYVGQYLPDWRPGRDYRELYSAKRDLGGGVIRDLSHELDYLLHLLGPWKRIAAIAGKFSDLEIDSEDCACLLAEFEHCPAASVHLNYLDRGKRRELIVNTDQDTLRVDLINGTVRGERSGALLEDGTVDLYERLHRNVLDGNYDGLSTGSEAFEVMRLIDAVQEAAETKQWIQN